MSLGRRLLLLIATLSLGLLLIAATTMWGVARLNRNLGAALSAYDTLRQLYGIGMELTRIQDAPDADLRLLTVLPQIDRVDDDAARSRLRTVLAGDDDAAVRIRRGLNTVMSAVADTKGRIRQLEARSQQQRRTTLVAMIALSVLTLAGVGVMVRGQLRALDSQVRAKSAELAQAERLASVGFLAAGVAHELNNPLAIIAGEAELGLRRAQGQEQHALQVIRGEAFRGKAITTKLLSLARSDAVEAQPLSLADAARDVVELTARMARFKDRAVSVTVADTVPVLGDRTLVTQVLVNLVVNALEATPVAGRVSVTVTGPRVAVTDTGRGMAGDEIARAFEPFYTSKRGPSSAAEGHGLGLSISHALVQRMGGTLTAHSDGRDRGCRFTLTLPAVS